MKTIILGQHANAKKRQEGMLDIHRKLTLEGYEKADSVSSQVKAEYDKCSKDNPFIGCSNALRTITEAEIIAEDINYPVNRIEKNDVFYQDPNRLVKGCVLRVARIMKEHDFTTIISHIPTVPILIDLLTKFKLKDLNEAVDFYFNQPGNLVDVDTYMDNSSVPFYKGNAYVLKYDKTGRAELDKVLK